MADFQPRFVDLVRNYTTTTGTGDFALSAAVNGYASFNTALQPGDQFYYSAISLDKPMEREVGRGTLQSNRTITRDPVSGIKTPFTGGTKTLSLIAAAEWFNTIQAAGGSGGGGGGTSTVGSRNALAALANRQPAVVLTEPGREGLFVFDTSELSAKVAADPYQAIYVAAGGATDGKTGAWVRRFDGPMQASWAGFANGAANNAARLESLVTLADAARGNVVELPLGTFVLDRRVALAQPCTVRGRGGAKGHSGGAGRTHIVAPAGFPAFMLTPAAQQSRIEDMVIGQTSLIATVGKASYAPATSLTTITGCTLLDIQNDQVIRLEGAGGSMVLVGRTASVAAGSNSVSVNQVGDFGNFYFYAGQMVKVAGAGAGGADLIGYVGTLGYTGDFTLVDVAGAALNASTTVSAAQITSFAPLIARVLSGGGTATLTIDTNPHNPLAVTGAKISHCAPAIYATTQCHAGGIEVGADAQAGLIICGRTTGGEVADNGSFYDCTFSGEFAGVIFQGNDAQVNSFFACDFAGPRVSVIDNSILGNYFYGCHWAFNCGFQFFNPYCQIHGGYVESNTGWTAAGGWFAYTMSLVNGGGLKGIGAPDSTGVQTPGLNAVGPVWAKGDPTGGAPSLIVTGGANSFNTKFEGPGHVHLENNCSGGNLLRLLGNGTSGYFIDCTTSIFYNAASSNAHDFRINAATEVTIDANGVNLAPGNVFKVAGTKVIGAQGAALPVDATDLASAVTLVNAIKARMKATGGHGLVAD